MAGNLVKTQEKKYCRFSWPNFVLYEGREIRCCEKNPTFARYMLPAGFMNRYIILSKDELTRHCHNN